MAELFKSAPESSLLHCVDPAEVLHADSDAPVSHKKMQELVVSPAPVIWIGGSEPLVHAGIGHLVRALARSGHFVFLETDGTFLRRRIHEFQPLPQVFLAVRLNALQSPGPALAVEGVRASRLSGFFTVLHSPITEEADLAQLTSVRAFFLERDADGWLITAGSESELVARKAAKARQLIPSSFWRQFSEDVEQALLSQTQKLHDASAITAAKPRAEAHEEGLGVA